MNLQQLLSNRKVQLGGLAAAGGVGAYVLIRRKQTTGSSSASPAAVVSPAAGGVGTFDSTGTDVANWLGNYSGNLQNQLDAFSQTLHDSLSGVSQIPTQGPGTLRQQFYHPTIDPKTGEYKVEFGAEPSWTNNIGSIAYAYGYTSPQQLWDDPANASLKAKYGGVVPTGGMLSKGDVVYAKFNPGADWSTLFPNRYDPSPWLTAVNNGTAQKL